MQVPEEEEGPSQASSSEEGRTNDAREWRTVAEYSYAASEPDDAHATSESDNAHAASEPDDAHAASEPDNAHAASESYDAHTAEP